ncbi:MAG: hypothetical protein JSR83_15735 [Proteobacteria bacterium]|nr:hypothetical protein [Pseudomonadota bacterium]
MFRQTMPARRRWPRLRVEDDSLGAADRPGLAVTVRLPLAASADSAHDE